MEKRHRVEGAGRQTAHEDAAGGRAAAGQAGQVDNQRGSTVRCQCAAAEIESVVIVGGQTGHLNQQVAVVAEVGGTGRQRPDAGPGGAYRAATTGNDRSHRPRTPQNGAAAVDRHVADAAVDQQRTGADHRAVPVGVRTCERFGAGASLDDTTAAAADHARKTAAQVVAVADGHRVVAEADAGGGAATVEGAQSLVGSQVHGSTVGESDIGLRAQGSGCVQVQRPAGDVHGSAVDQAAGCAAECDGAAVLRGNRPSRAAVTQRAQGKRTGSRAVLGNVERGVASQCDVRGCQRVGCIGPGRAAGHR